MKKNLPLISISIPTYNEERFIDSCLKSIFNQDYPKEKIQVIIIDNYSTDNTLLLAKKYPVEIIQDKTKDAQYLKMLGLKKSKGEYFIFMDADSRLTHKSWFRIMLEPHVDPQIVGVFTDIIPDKRDPLISQYIASFSFYTSPLFSFFSQRVEDTITNKKEDFYYCNYSEKITPPTGSSLYKMRFLKEAGILKQEKFMELDVLRILVLKGFTKFVYNPKTGIQHSHVDHLSEIFHKRIRNINRNYIKDLNKRHFLWIDFNDKKSILKIIVWMLYANTFVFPTITGAIKAIKNRQLFFLYYEPLVAFIETIAVIYSMLIHPSRAQFFKRLFSQK